jgi:DNA-binding PadR family transcriptional regulator
MYYDSLILGLILCRPVHGYEIKGHLEQFNRNINGTEVSNNTIYPLLAKFEKHGITTKQVVLQDGKPSKKLYAITDYGRQYFYENINTISRSVITSREEFCIRLLFFSAITPEIRRKLLDERATHLQASLVTDERPLHEWPVVADDFNLELAVENLLPFYNNVLNEELRLIEHYRRHIDDPCTIPADIHLPSAR